MPSSFERTHPLLFSSLPDSHPLGQLDLDAFVDQPTPIFPDGKKLSEAPSHDVNYIQTEDHEPINLYTE